MESEAITINLPNLVLEKLRCFICKGYLSCSPVCVSQDGSCICGNCSPLNSDMPVYRVLPLEEILSKTLFPCRFKEHGCTENLLFGRVADHQTKCAYRPLPCPSLTTCLWQGLPSNLYDHFNKQHADFIKEKAEFNFLVAENSEGVLMAVEDSFIFIIKYYYNANETTLKYVIRFCANKIGYDVSVKSQLTNASDINCLVSLKTKCSVYDESFFEIMQDAVLLNLNKFMHSLGDANSIAVAMKPIVAKSSNHRGTLENYCFDLIESLKCHLCRIYLIPPLFDLDGQAICFTCAKDNSSCKPSSDTDILKLVNEALYPCRWRGCNFMGNSEHFDNHQRACQFRLYLCLYKTCDDTFSLSNAVNHFQQIHNLNYLVGDAILYKTSFAKKYKAEDVITTTNNIPIVIVHSMLIFTHCVNIYKMQGHLTKPTATIQFEHQHCKLKSRQFTANHRLPLNVALKQLPSCFKEQDELTVTVKLKII